MFESSCLDSDATAQREELEKAYYDQLRDWPYGGISVATVHAAEGITSLDNDHNDTFEFRLFSRKPCINSLPLNGPVLQKIVLRSPTPINKSPGFLIPRRPDAYYFTEKVTNAKTTEQYQSAAVAGEDVIAGLHQLWHGFKLPWRVTVIKLEGDSNLSAFSQSDQKTSPTKKRNGKKRRIAIRKKAMSREEKKLNERRRKEEIEAAEKEKRTRKNREKKGKKRQRDKLKKTAITLEQG